jgi:K+-sensing histidine kinase KdpD
LHLRLPGAAQRLLLALVPVILVALIGALTYERSRLVVADVRQVERSHETLERIFDPFWQVEQRSTRKVGGSGLGLSVSRSLARLVGGDVRVQSEPGKGSTFTLTLPVGEA